MRYIIVATGPSLRQLTVDIENLPDTKIVVVNGAVNFVKKPDVFFTLDCSPRNIAYAKMAEQKGSKIVVAADRWDYRLPDKTILLKRYGSGAVKPENPYTPEEWFDRWSCLKGLSEDKLGVNTGNSCYGALNYVYWQKPEKIVILGLDGTQEPSMKYMHRPFNLSHLPMLFESAKDQLDKAGIQVMNGSPDSKIECFEKISANNAIKWLQS